MTLVRSVKLLVQWAIMLGASWLAAALLAQRFPGASSLIGPMLVATAMGLRGSSIAIPRSALHCAQAITGCAIASTISPEGLAIATGNLWQLLLVVLLTLLGAVAIGCILMRFGSLPGTSAAWGTLPGGAPAMAALADQNGGNGVIVSVMQYLRVGMVVWTTSLIAQLLVSQDATNAVTLARASVATPVVGAATVTSTMVAIGIALVGVWLSARFRIAGGSLLVPLVLGTAANVTQPGLLQVPTAVLTVSFAIIGWAIGLQFRRDLGRTLLVNFPLMLVAIGALIGVCSVCAWILTLVMPVNAVTAFLATAPGGLDTIGAIAMGLPSDMAIVTATHTLRLFVVMLVGPWIVRYMTMVLQRQDSST